ncbi:MAG: FAD-binding protein [Pyrobaculum sp.]
MSFVAFFKQIPDLNFIRLDPATKRIVREGVPNVMNPFDYHAIEGALYLRDALGGRAVAVTMGPPSFKQSAEEALAMGVDLVVHLSDKAFAGSDTLATSRALARAVKAFAPDYKAIFAGKYSWDGDTGHVGPQTAELLGIPHVSGVVEVRIKGERASVRREAEDGEEELEVELPALFTVTDRAFNPRPPGKPKGRYVVATAADIGVDLSEVGAAGSPTVVEDLYEERWERAGGVAVDARNDPDIGAEALWRWLKTVVSSADRGGAVREAPVRERGPRVVAVVADDKWDGGLRRVSLELLGKAVELAEAVGGTVVALYGGLEDPRTLIAHGADEVVWIREADPFDIYAHGEALAEFILKRKPWAVLAPSTTYGRDLMSRVAARLGLGLTADCVDFSVRGGELLQHKPAFGGGVVSIIRSKTYPQMATARPGMFEPLAPNPKRSGEVLEIKARPRMRTTSRTPRASEWPDPQEAGVVVGVGRGFKKPENLKPALDLAKALGAAVAATRNVVLAGWLPYRLQVGVSGKAIAPLAYLALAIRGDVNHVVGIRRARHIAAVNINPRAEIFKIAELGVVGDVNKIVPLLLERAVKEPLFKN